RRDEYLQASLFSLEQRQVRIGLDLAPGVAVLPFVLGVIDTDGDGKLSEAEQGTYAARVLRDLSVSVDGEPVRLRLLSRQFPSVEEMKEGLGTIRLEIGGDVPGGYSGQRRLGFENRHERRVAAAMVNRLVPAGPGL